MNTMIPKTLYLLRHGETDWNALGRFQGHTDVPLNETGREQAKALPPLVAALAPTLVVSSDLSRAVETARIAAAQLHPQPLFAIDSRLRESHLGSAEGMAHGDVLRIYGPQLIEKWRSWEEKDLDSRFPQGESGREVQSRLWAAINDAILQNPAANKILICSHGGAIRRVLQKILNPSEKTGLIPNCAIYEIQRDADGLWVGRGFVNHL